MYVDTKTNLVTLSVQELIQIVEQIDRLTELTMTIGTSLLTQPKLFPELSKSKSASFETKINQSLIDLMYDLQQLKYTNDFGHLQN